MDEIVPDSAAITSLDARYRLLAGECGRVEAEVRDRLEWRPSVRVQLAVKRLIDVTFSLWLILLLSPVLVLTALAVRLSSPGPVLYSNKRWGLHETLFTCYKFRSMRVDQDKVIDTEAVDRVQKHGLLVKLKRDPRVTPVGMFIRKTSVDELPQLFNVLRGDMSLVGPRPLVPHMLLPFPEMRRVRCLVRPGITGLWQVRDRENNTSVIGMAKYDLEYLSHFSIWLDLKILVMTVPAVLLAKGAC